MKYWGDTLEFPYAEAEPNPSVEQVKEIEKADILLGSMEDAKKFLKPDAGVVILSATTDELEQIKNRAIIVGAHALTKNGRALLAARYARCYTMFAMSMEGLPRICDAAMEAANVWPSMQLLVSPTVLDAAFSPDGVAGGVSARELIYLVQRFSLMRNYQGAAILCPPDSFAAKLVIEAAPKGKKA